MSGRDNEPPAPGGRRKDGRPYRENNTGGDGDYIVGRNRPPKAGQFRHDDGRPRGRKPKGAENADTFFERELNRKILIREDGKERKVTKGQGVDVRLISNAGRGDIRSIEFVDQRRQRVIANKEETARRYHTLSDAEILHRYLQERSEELAIDPDLFGDPPGEDEAGDDPAQETVDG